MDQLVARLRTGQLYAMTGSGVSVSAGYRTWEEVVARLAAVVMERSGAGIAGIDAEVIVRTQQDPLLCAQFLSRELSPEDFASFIRQEFRPNGKPPHELLIRLAQMPFKHILTLNFDESMEEAHDAMKLSYGKVSCSARAATSRFLDSIDSPDCPRQIVHLHGVYTDPTETIVLTEDGYRRMYRDSNLFEHFLWLLAATKRIVFLGFGFKDIDFLNAMRDAARDMNRDAARDIENRNWTGHFAVLPISPTEDDVPIRRDHNYRYFVEPIFYERVEGGDDPYARFLPLINGILHQLDLPARPAIEIAEPAVAAELIAEPGDLQRAADLAEQFLGKIDPGANNA
ncbi:MAG: SIR2 family protein [Candidatus Acidiferrales bacterium]